MAGIHRFGAGEKKRIIVQPSLKYAPAGDYEIGMAELRKADERDHAWFQAEKLQEMLPWKLGVSRC
jgi:hypothetical protein